MILRYRSLTPKTRLIPLSPPFIEYLRSDGIVLPPDDQSSADEVDEDAWTSSTVTATVEPEDEEPDPSLPWLDLHHNIKAKITELDGSVMPKLNWSAPKDATWISATNNMECRTPNDIYLLLKSSDFITHDLEHAFDDCEDDRDSDNPTPNDSSHNGGNSSDGQSQEIPYHLVLRKTIPAMATSLEFRCFVRNRQLLCICQRDLNHFPFLTALVHDIRSLIQRLFNTNLKSTFPDENFVFDVYISPSRAKAWLIDINPWAPRTDPLLFSWLEILDMGIEDEHGISVDTKDSGSEAGSEAEIEDDIVGEESTIVPEIRLVKHDDPEAYNFSTSQYSAHKLPKDLVDASINGEAGIMEFMGRWREIVAGQEKEVANEEESMPL